MWPHGHKASGVLNSGGEPEWVPFPNWEGMQKRRAIPQKRAPVSCEGEEINVVLVRFVGMPAQGAPKTWFGHQ